VSSAAAPTRWCRGFGRGGDRWLLALAVGLSFDDELPCCAFEPVDGGLGEEWVGHDRQPLTRVAVRGQHRCRLVVALNADLVDVGCFGGVERLKREVIDLCRRRHNSTYAEPGTMPTIGVEMTGELGVLVLFGVVGSA
jgi:hypothetical protein